MPATCLVVGATGATGRLLVRQLLERGQQVRAIVRSRERLPADLRAHDALHVTEASVLDLSDSQLAEQVRGCAAVASCLGHNMSFKGVFGRPRRLVAGATRRLCEAIRAAGAQTPTRFVLMCSAGVRNRDLGERVSLAERGVLALLRVLVPPHADNEQAAEHLRARVGQRDPAIEWAVVRPDSLIDSAAVTAYDVHPSPVRSAIFNAGKTSRVNVAHFMAELVTGEHAWSTWRGAMPVIYNREEPRG